MPGRKRRDPSSAIPQRQQPRDRILTAATELFETRGVARTGVDAIIARAGVAKATFYRQFPSKDGLIVAWLRDPRTRWFERVRAVAESRAAGPRDLVARLFEATAEWLQGNDFRGCPYLNTITAINDPNRLPTSTSLEYLSEIGSYLEDAAAAAGQPDPARAGRELHGLLAGSITLGVARRTTAHAFAARDVAMRLLAS